MILLCRALQYLQFYRCSVIMLHIYLLNHLFYAFLEAWIYLNVLFYFSNYLLANVAGNCPTCLSQMIKLSCILRLMTNHV